MESEIGGLLPYTWWPDKSNPGVRRGVGRFQRFFDFFEYWPSANEVGIFCEGHIVKGIAVDVDFYFSQGVSIAPSCPLAQFSMATPTCLAVESVLVDRSPVEVGHL